MSIKIEVHTHPDIGLSDGQLLGVTDILNTLLCDEYLLYTQSRNYHWNVTGRHFNDLHKFFEAQYVMLDEVVDEVAERVRALGGKARGTLFELAEHSRLKEEAGEYPDAAEMLKNLLDNHETLIRYLRSDIAKCDQKYQDAGNADFLAGVLVKHEKAAWMLRSLLEG